MATWNVCGRQQLETLPLCSPWETAENHEKSRVTIAGLRKGKIGRIATCGGGGGGGGGCGGGGGGCGGGGCGGDDSIQKLVFILEAHCVLSDRQP